MRKNRRHYRITETDVLAAHQEALKYGGRDGILDWNLIASAIARPYSTFDGKILYRRIWHKAAALLQSLARNHGFVDGNKRTSLICLMILIERSGFSLQASNNELEKFILDVAESRIDFREATEWFSDRIKSE